MEPSILLTHSFADKGLAVVLHVLKRCPHAVACVAGHVVAGKQDVLATVHGSFLCASIEIGTLRRALMYACELRQAKPRTMSRTQLPSADLTAGPSGLWTQTASGDIPGPTSGSVMAQAPRLSGASAAELQAARSSADAGRLQAQAKAKRNLTVQIFLHCARIDVSPCRLT